MDDVAKRAGVGTSTASRALSGRGYVSADVRERVLKAAAELGYLPHLNARSLRAGSSVDIGVVVSNLRDTFYSELATAIEATLKSRGYSMILMTDDGDEQTQAATVDTLLAKRVAGVILTPVSAQVVQRLVSNELPVVQADRVVARPRTDAVLGANEQGAFDATDHLLANGHRDVAMLIDEAKWTTGRQRLKGFRRAHATRGLTVDESLVVFAPGSVDEIRARVGELVVARPDVTAVIAGNGLLAEGAYSELQHRGLRVPRDISLVAYDDVPWMAMVRPGITAVAQHTDLLGRACAETLLSRLEGSPGTAWHTVAIPPSLVVRGSVRRLPG